MAKPPEAGRDWGEATRLVRAGAGPDEVLARTVGPPVQRGSTVLVPHASALYDPAFTTYGRHGLASHKALAEALGAVEGGVHAQLFSSGLAAVTGAMLAVLQAGDEVIAVDCVYAPIRRFCDGVLGRFGVTTRYVPSRAGAEEIMALAGPATRLIVLESPGSLTFEMQDVPAIAAAARARGILTLIDNTYGAGVLFKPLAHGVDLSVQALTKYVGGHSDVFMGSAATADAGLAARLKATVRDSGWAVSPDDAYQMLRGLRTLTARLDRHGASGLEVARWLAAQPEVARVLHPALPAFPDHGLWARDFSGANGLFSVELRPAPPAAALAMLDALELFGLGFSWGGFESLAIHCDPQLKTSRTAEPWAARGPLVRLHVGLEDPADLIADLRRGLDAFANHVP
ncbi:MAG TPA: cystathionine beta-lyase [Caulobacteraceae bacterium]|jgi:cystathionine beta-lyase|nr:cystathionine beta-lyase [Caulobacteraceae bacterium]